MKVIVPMAGAGSRFVVAGYDKPKPMIDVLGAPMIQRVVESVGLQDHPHIFIVQRQHLLDHPSLEELLVSLAEDVSIVQIDGLTEGAAETCLSCAHLINNDEPILTVNSDQIMEWDAIDFVEHVSGEMDGCILTFHADNPAYSYAALDEKGLVTRTAEKEVISEWATVGLYYWSKGRDFVRAARDMIDKDIRFKNEYYVCPVYNENIAWGQEVTTYSKGKFHLVGTPDELTAYLELINGRS
jgi:NDP-sugar pyrophosphorylase family protein